MVAGAEVTSLLAMTDPVRHYVSAEAHTLQPPGEHTFSCMRVDAAATQQGKFRVDAASRSVAAVPRRHTLLMMTFPGATVARTRRTLTCVPAWSCGSLPNSLFPVLRRRLYIMLALEDAPHQVGAAVAAEH